MPKTYVLQGIVNECGVNLYTSSMYKDITG